MSEIADAPTLSDPSTTYGRLYLDLNAEIPGTPARVMAEFLALITTLPRFEFIQTEELEGFAISLDKEMEMRGWVRAQKPNPSSS